MKIIVIETNQYELSRVFFSEKTEKKNEFIKIYYSTINATLNNICIELFFTDIIVNSKEILLNKETNKNALDFMRQIENGILNKMVNDKVKTHIIHKNIQDNELKFILPKKTAIINDVNCVLKISGIWSNENKYGLTYQIHQIIIN
jgi:hypothetical protein